MKRAIFSFLFVLAVLLFCDNVFALQVRQSVPVDTKPAEAKQPEVRQATKPDTGSKNGTIKATVSLPKVRENVQFWKAQSNDSLGIYINKPTIRLLGGTAKSFFEQENTSSVSNKLYNAEIDLGFGDVIEFNPNESWFSIVRDTTASKANALRYPHLGKYTFAGVSFSFVNELENSGEPGSNMTSMWSVGFSDLEGYGYKFKNGLSLKFITGLASMWSWLSIIEAAQPLDDEFASQETFSDFRIFDGSVRYGVKYQSEIGLQIGNHVSVLANANRTLVYPRTLFWKMTGSAIIYGIAENVFDIFTNSVKRHSPSYYPIVNFVLRTGLYFGMSELQKSRSHFPFKSVSPLSVDHVRLGLQFSF